MANADSPPGTPKVHLFKPSDWPFIWKFLVPAVVSVVLIVTLAVTASLALQTQTRRMNTVVAGALQNAVFLGHVRAELRGDARDLYAALASGDVTATEDATKVSENLKALQEEVKQRAASATGEDKTAFTTLVTEIGTQKDSVDVVTSMLGIDLAAAKSFLEPYKVSEEKTDAIAEQIIQASNAKAKALAAESVASAKTQMMIVVGLSVLAALCAGGFGLVIGRTTSRAVQAIAQTTRRLAEGDMTVTTGSLQRNDELGQVVAALAVFKEVTEQSRALSHDQEEAGRARIERAAHMEQLINGFNRDFAGLIRGVEKASSHLEQSASILTTTSAENTSRASSAVNSIFSVRDSMSTVAAASEELGATISEVDRQASASANVARDATERAETTQTAVAQLTTAVGRINEIVDLISSVAKQTNLLALNATIEAARAGDMGKGFAVVASEVKELARQTQQAIGAIDGKISAAQADTAQAIAAIQQIGAIIARINEFQSVIAAAVEEQSAASQEIGRNVGETAKGADEIARNITGVSQAAADTLHGASETHQAATILAELASQLNATLSRFTFK